MSYVDILLEAIWFILPAYIANAVPVVVRGKDAVDRGRKMAGGLPVLGAGKTWEGTISGIAAGGVAGYLQGISSLFPLVPMSIGLGLALGAGAMLGDMAASFLKRRAGLRRGANVFLLDQLDFIIGALATAVLVADVKLAWIVVWLLLTPLLHRLTNVIGYILGLKKVPW